MTQIERHRFISRIIEFDMSAHNYASPAGRDDFFAMILRDGFAGYHNMTDDELRNEAYNRGIDL